ncbi:MAG: aldehyde dehydrogenase family protein [Anaerolineae bacterium]|nr:aldehyde dehydrogenase family protein [Anaerolineae bacterium]
MLLQPVLIAGEWRQAQNPVGDFAAVNPTTKLPLPDRFPVSGRADVELALQAAQEAVVALRSIPSDAIAHFLELFADNIEARAEALVELGNLETALPPDPRLRSVELPRTTDQLRQAATAARTRSWCHATIDTQANTRSKYGPLGGPVIVFGPNNFPFAFNSAAGGDFAAAIAAGNPVIAKANTGHPGTTRLFAEAAFEAAQASGLPVTMVQLLYRIPPEVGLELVSHPLTGATGFTGSKSAGLRLKEAADKAGKPIYLEMSSVNPVFVMPGALDERLAVVAGELYASCALGAGQFCTNPGLVIVPEGEAGEGFLAEVRVLFAANPAGTLLGAQGPTGIAAAIEVLQQHGAEIITGGQALEASGYCFANTLLRVSGDSFLAHPGALQTEAFGTVSLMVFARDTEQMKEIASALEGNLTGCIYSHSQGRDEAIYVQIEPILRQKVGRLLNDKMPTGVAVSPAMNHGGPYPATGHPGFTAVGIPASLLRFAALHCYDNVRPHRLPPELQNKNPTGKMWRSIDGEWTQKDIE